MFEKLRNKRIVGLEQEKKALEIELAQAERKIKRLEDEMGNVIHMAHQSARNACTGCATREGQECTHHVRITVEKG